jgi:hypothetical protein
MSNPRDPAFLDQTILLQCLARGKGKTICPSDVARVLERQNWQRLLPLIRQQAVALALAGSVMIFRKGKPVNPEDFKGVYRIGLPVDGSLVEE